MTLQEINELFPPEYGGNAQISDLRLALSRINTEVFTKNNLEDLDDVSINNPNNGNFLSFNASNNKWENSDKIDTDSAIELRVGPSREFKTISEVYSYIENRVKLNSNQYNVLIDPGVYTIESSQSNIWEINLTCVVFFTTATGDKDVTIVLKNASGSPTSQAGLYCKNGIVYFENIKFEMSKDDGNTQLTYGIYTINAYVDFRSCDFDFNNVKYCFYIRMESRIHLGRSPGKSTNITTDTFTNIFIISDGSSVYIWREFNITALNPVNNYASVFSLYFKSFLSMSYTSNSVIDGGGSGSLVSLLFNSVAYVHGDMTIKNFTNVFYVGGISTVIVNNANTLENVPEGVSSLETNAFLNDKSMIMEAYSFDWNKLKLEYGLNIYNDGTAELENSAPDVILSRGEKAITTIEYVNLNGATANRPSSPNTGQYFFDTDLNKPIWYNGSSWVDANGTEV